MLSYNGIVFTFDPFTSSKCGNVKSRRMRYLIYYKMRPWYQDYTVTYCNYPVVTNTVLYIVNTLFTFITMVYDIYYIILLTALSYNKTSPTVT